MNRNCPECDGPHDCSGAWRDCLEYWKKRCLKAEAENARLAAAFQNVVAFLATEKARCKTMIEKCEKEGDTHGTNFHQGMFSGFNQAGSAIQAKNIFYLGNLLAPVIEALNAAKQLMDSCSIYQRSKDAPPARFSFGQVSELVNEQLTRLRGLVERKHERTL